MSSLFNTLNISRQDMLTRLLDLDTVSNNLANMNTTGFKASRSNFQELLDRRLNRSGIIMPATQVLTAQGNIKQTANALDWAIQGEGYFQVRLPDGRTGYTRDGQLSLDAARNLVTASGARLIWNGTLPDGYQDVNIREDGTVEALMNDGTRINAGTIQLATFVNPSALTGAGQNVWIPSLDSGPARVGAPNTTGMGSVQSHQVEMSNVDISREMTQLMTDQRTFQMSVQAFQQTDQMIAQALNLRKA